MCISHWSLRALIIGCLEVTTSGHKPKTLQNVFWYLFFSCYANGEAALNTDPCLKLSCSQNVTVAVNMITVVSAEMD